MVLWKLHFADGAKQTAHPYHLDKENRPTMVNETSEEDLIQTVPRVQHNVWTPETCNIAMHDGGGDQGKDENGDLTNLNVKLYGQDVLHVGESEEEATGKNNLVEDLGPVYRDLNTEIEIHDITNGPSTWEIFIENPTKIRWPEMWSGNDNLDLDNSAWNEVLKDARATSDKKCLPRKGGGSQAKEKRSKRSADRMKKNFGKNLKPRDNGGTVDANGKVARVAMQPLGFSDFKNGTNKVKKKKGQEGCKQQKRKFIGDFYKEVADREEGLLETVGNIISTDANVNNKLLNSIQSMRSCKLSKFSAKVNESGEVSIDENMIEKEDQSAPDVQKSPETPLFLMLTC
ncbi:hypothetical protein L1987_24183 [Smallanthus sonchifolius]|uniref:Uncharacterized protein n=1 Tax=Smallanthus sonchifolius TaxID=185202 RepID=A0ACB9IJY6_9ASTR|nr:hypothetical protein L1987_24183 [Smallanthus sonchifolius]